jgi:hypothetical protein
MFLPGLSTIISVLVPASIALVLGWMVWSLVERLRRPPSAERYEAPPRKPRRPLGRQWWG